MCAVKDRVADDDGILTSLVYSSIFCKCHMLRVSPL
jgi:hypothetical protein